MENTQISLSLYIYIGLCRGKSMFAHIHVIACIYSLNWHMDNVGMHISNTCIRNRCSAKDTHSEFSEFKVCIHTCTKVPFVQVCIHTCTKGTNQLITEASRRVCGVGSAPSEKKC